MATLQDLAGLAALVWGTKYQNKNIRRANRERLAEIQADRQLKQQTLDMQRKQAEREQAWTEAKPFYDVLTASDSADRLANMAGQGTLGGFLDNAEAMFKRAGLPFDVSRYRVHAPRTNVDLSGVGPGSQAPPVGAPAEGLTGASMGAMATPQTTLRPGMAAPGTPVPAFNRLSAGMSGPPTPIADLPDARLAQLFGALPAGMQGPGTPVSAMRPPQQTPPSAATPPDPVSPVVEPFDEEEAYRERYQPGALTSAKIARMVNQSANDLARRGLWKSQIEKNQAQAQVTRLLAHPRAVQMMAAAGLADERAATVALLRDAQLRETIAKAVNLEDMPGSRAAARGVQLEGIRTRAETADEDRAGRASEGAANRASREGIAAAARLLKSGGATGIPKGSAPFVKAYASLATKSKKGMYGVSEPLTEAERDEEAARINAAHQDLFGKPLFGPGSVLEQANTGATSAPAPRMGRATAAPAAGSPLPEKLINMVSQSIDAGTYKRMLGETPAEYREAVKRAFAEVQKRRKAKGR